MDSVAAADSIRAEEGAHPGWIHSPAFDLAFFILSPLAGFGLAVLGVRYPALLPVILVGASYAIGVPHYLASFAFFLGDENRAYANGLWYLFYAAPLAICLAVFGLHAAGVGTVVFAVLFVWNTFHVATQSSGILSLYRRLAGGGAGERVWGHRMILFANAAMAFWFIERFPPLADPMVALHAALPDLVRYGFLLAAFGCGAFYAREVARRGFGLSGAEAACLASALLLFTPYLWLEDANFATVAMLVGHFIQYLAIVWLLNRRKYRPPSGSRGERWLARMSASWPQVLVFMFLVGVAFYAFDKGSRLLQASTIFFMVFNALALVHFYLDGLIWAFRNPFIRRTVGPYLTLDAHRIR